MVRNQKECTKRIERKGMEKKFKIKMQMKRIHLIFRKNCCFSHLSTSKSQKSRYRHDPNSILKQTLYHKPEALRQYWNQTIKPYLSCLNLMVKSSKNSFDFFFPPNIRSDIFCSSEYENSCYLPAVSITAIKTSAKINQYSTNFFWTFYKIFYDIFEDKNEWIRAPREKHDTFVELNCLLIELLYSSFIRQPLWINILNLHTRCKSFV